MKQLLIVFFAALCSFFLGTFIVHEEHVPPLAFAQAPPSSFASCKFTKGDQNPKDEPYQSPLLLSYFKEVSEKTGVPATVLAGIARVESTTGRYTISHYTDGDIREMEDTAKSLQNIDDVIGRSTKARCPRSPTGALGLMQIQPPRQVHDVVRDQLTENGDSQIPTFDKVGAHDGEAVANGIRLAIAAGALPAGTTVDALTIEDFCNPKRNLYLSAGFILKKMQRLGHGDGTKWDPSWNTNKTYFDAVASSYYGCLKYPSCSAGPNSYGDDLWASSQSCKADIALSPADTTLPFVNFISESNIVTTRVGNPVCGPGSGTSSNFATLPGKSAVYILSKSSTTGKDEDTPVPAYSVIKLWVAAAAYNASEQGKINLTATYTVEDKDKVGGTGVLNYGPLPVTHSFEKLIELMLTNSDNVATNILIKQLGGLDQINAYSQKAGYTKTVMERFIGQQATPEKDNMTSAKDAATFMNNLMNNQVVNPAVSAKIRSYLEKRNTVEKDEFMYARKGLPTEASFIGKSGVGPNPIVRNDVGTFINKNNERVFMAVFLSDLEGEKLGENAIRELAVQIYNSSPSSTNPCPPTTGGGIASCPLKGKRVIGCGSFMSDPKFNRGVCLGPQPINRGHCGTNYGCYKGSVEATNASRRSHSVDVDAPAGETVYLPTINGQSVTWSYAPYLSYPVAAGDGGGYGHVFYTTVGNDKWIMHLLHMNPPPLIPIPAGRSEYQSGDAVTTVAATGYPHLHINIGRNPETNNGGAGWLNPEDLGMCTE